MHRAVISLPRTANLKSKKNVGQLMFTIFAFGCFSGQDFVWIITYYDEFSRAQSTMPNGLFQTDFNGDHSANAFQSFSR
jgi:hypothetical protein